MTLSALTMAAVLLGCAGPQQPARKTMATLSPRSHPDLPGAVPPIAARKAFAHRYHGREWPDPYHWLRDKKDPATIAYLKAENRYTSRFEAKHEALKKALYDELLGRLQEDDAEVPWRKGPWLYYSRTEKGKDYAIHCRKPVGGGAEQVLLDGNMLAKGHKHLAFGAIEISPDHRLLAYSIDHDGSERFELRVRDLATGKDLPDRVPGTYYGAEWGNDNKTLFYVTIDKAHRPYRLHRHALGEASSDDVIVLEEQDERFHLWLHKTRSERFVMATLESAITTEVRFIDADKPREAARVLAARRHGVEYKPAHHGSWWYIATNDGAEDFKLVRAPVTEPSVSRWEEVIGPRDGVLLEGVEAFADHLVIREREGGQRRLVVRQMSDGQQHVVPIDEPVHAIGTTDNREHDTTMLRLAWQSMRTPRTVVDYDMKTRKATVRKVAPVRGGHDLRRYSVQRLWATSHDGAKVPISLVARRDVQPRPGQPRAHPCLLTAYAAYGYSSSPRFDRERLALLERGFVVAIAHARGGSELGRRWKNAGKLQHKRNTFLDVVAVAEKLVADGWTTPQQLALRGGSAGGLLVGATINLRPKLFRAALALVPFVDVVNTMMDSSLPLTVIEHEEWGDPNDKRFFGVIAAYSPYDNVKAQRYPDLFVTAGLNDPRVHYWEPAKWVARLRAQAQGSLILLKTKMGAGHGGASGRYESLADEALEFAFLIDRLGAPSAALPMATQAEKP